MPPLPAAVAPVGDSLDEAQRYRTADPCFGVRVLQNARKRSWKDQLNYERRCASRKWVSIVASNPMAFEVARLQILAGPMEFAKGGLAESIAWQQVIQHSSCQGGSASQVLEVLRGQRSQGLPVGRGQSQ